MPQITLLPIRKMTFSPPWAVFLLIIIPPLYIFPPKAILITDVLVMEQKFIRNSSMKGPFSTIKQVIHCPFGYIRNSENFDHHNCGSCPWLISFTSALKTESYPIIRGL